MRVLLIAALLIASSFANAAEVLIMERNVPVMSSDFHSWADARFHMDTTTGEGFVKVSVTENRWVMAGSYDSTGRWYPRRTPMPMRVFSDTVKVEGLMLMDKKVIYHGTDGDVECGTMGVSRVFKVPTLYLNGNCSLSARLSGHWNQRSLTVTLKTK